MRIWRLGAAVKLRHDGVRRLGHELEDGVESNESEDVSFWVPSHSATEEASGGGGVLVGNERASSGRVGGEVISSACLKWLFELVEQQQMVEQQRAWRKILGRWGLAAVGQRSANPMG